MGSVEQERAAQYLPDATHYEVTVLPDLVVDDAAYVRTGVLTPQGNMILRRVTKPVGFTASHHWTPPGYKEEHTDD